MGHRFFILSVIQQDLGYDARRIIKRMEKEKADLWPVESTQAEVLRWFASRPQPVFAIGGQFVQVPGIAAAGSVPGPATLDTVRRFCELGHRRIVCLKERTIRSSLLFRQRFFATLEEAGNTPDAYNLPDLE